MDLRIAATQEQLDNIRELYEDAFPKSEKKPFAFILQKRDEGCFEILEITDEADCFCGLAIMMLYRDLALLDYFAIAPECRGTGVGSAALKALQEKYTGSKFMLEIESTVGLNALEVNRQNSDNEGREVTQMSAQVSALSEEEKSLRLRRKAFYLRNGMRPMDFQVDLFGVEMEILVHGERVSFEEYYSVLKSTVPPNLIHHVKLL